MDQTAQPQPCWNAFCIGEFCDGIHHYDNTGHSWTQSRGSRYCAECHTYTIDCGHESIVVTIYERQE